MASIAEIIIEFLSDILESFFAGGLITEEVVTEMTEIIPSIQTQITTDIEGGATADEAVTTAYQTVAGVDQGVANELAFQAAEEGINIQETGITQEEEIANGAEEANDSGPPDANDPENPDVEEYDPDDTPEESEAKTANNVSNSSVGAKLLAGFFLVVLFLFGIVFWVIWKVVCGIGCSIDQDLKHRNGTNKCGSDVKVWTCCQNTTCTNPFCKSIQGMRKFITKHRLALLIITPIVLIGLGIVFYKYIGIITPIILTLIIEGFILFMCSIIGYALVNSLCGLGEIVHIFNHL